MSILVVTILIVLMLRIISKAKGSCLLNLWGCTLLLHHLKLWILRHRTKYYCGVERWLIRILVFDLNFCSKVPSNLQRLSQLMCCISIYQYVLEHLWWGWVFVFWCGCRRRAINIVERSLANCVNIVWCTGGEVQISSCITERIPVSEWILLWVVVASESQGRVINRHFVLDQVPGTYRSR